MRWWGSSVGEGGLFEVLLYRMVKDVLQCSYFSVYAAYFTHVKDDSKRGFALPILYCTVAVSIGRLYPDESGRLHHYEKGSSWRTSCLTGRYQTVKNRLEMTTMSNSCFFFLPSLNQIPQKCSISLELIKCTFCTSIQHHL
jgi:hypothetical protein